MSVIFAADLSLTNTGVAVGADGKVRGSFVIPVKGDGMGRLISMRNMICDQIDKAKPNLIIFEDLAFSMNKAYAKENAGLAYMIRAELHTDAMCPWLLVGASQLKKYAVGSGGSKKAKVGKDLVILNVFKKWGHDVDNSDQADALALCHIGMALMGDEEPTIDPQREVLAALRKANPWLRTIPPVECSKGEQ